MVSKLKSLDFHIYTWEEIEEIFYKKKFQNVILFSQPRSGSTFVSNVLAKQWNYPNRFFPEEFFLGQHFVYLKSFIKKNDSFFLNTNEFWFRRINLKKERTMYLYLYRSSEEILNSYSKARAKDYYLGWEERINKYRKFFPTIDSSISAPLFGHKVWEIQSKIIANSFAISYESFKTHRFYLSDDIRKKKYKPESNMKQIEIEENKNIPLITSYGKMKDENKILDNLSYFQKIYCFFRRKIESRKINIKNY